MKNYQFYHIYPLGMLENEGLGRLHQFIPHLKALNINAVYLGPVFSSQSHGYDTIDYLSVDSRLGCNGDLVNFVKACHDQEMDVILDCVFNHVSREFFAFKDLMLNKQQSIYRDWFCLDFSKDNHRRDGFSYETWDGHDTLVKLNLHNKQVADYLIEVVKNWINWFNIDGLRLDAADVMDRGFIKRLNQEMLLLKKDFFIMAEMVHGNYWEMIAQTGITAVTNYECYKGLYSSLNDRNYYEIAHSLNRLFSNKKEGHSKLVDSTDSTFSPPLLYNFVDNHDVNRVASQLKEPGYLYPLYLMLYTIPGIVSLYYKSELGAKGVRTYTSDAQLRAPFRLNEIEPTNPLLCFIQKLSSIRKAFPQLMFNDYREILVDHQLIGYLRGEGVNKILVLINSSQQNIRLTSEQISKIRGMFDHQVYDLLEEKVFSLEHGYLYPNYGRILVDGTSR
jgi:glycosidase